jgi:type IV pilus assembly protein PilY1
MNNALLQRSRVADAMSRLLCMSLLVFGLGVASSPAGATSVGVDQSPLTIQRSLPPNIVLMLDDSGSMAWNYMPDWSYLKNNTNNDALINASNNGVYYNPTITYLPPTMPDGNSAYPAPTGLTSTWVDGFAVTKVLVDLTNYDGSYETDNRIYFTPPTSITTSNVKSSSACNTLKANDSKATGASYDSKKQTCTLTYPTISAFQYSTGPATGPYVVGYVADQSCASLSNCVVASDISGTAAPKGVQAGQNVANWFAYYHTRILMAKSGLMNAFVGIDAKYRVGFGSIDGGEKGNSNYKNLPATRYTYTDGYNGGSNYIAQVQPFGSGAKNADGPSPNDQKTAFWAWVAAAKASGGTPLRQALDAVGTYYTTDQPWKTMSTDPVPETTPELACRQSYTILTTDGFWNDSYSGAGDVDSAAGSKITGPNGKTYTYQPSAPYKDGVKDTLADYAMKYWATDLRPKTDNTVPTSDEDPAFWQHMTTFTLGLGFTPTNISPAGTTIEKIFKWANGGTAITGFSWPTPASNDINNIADLAHAAVNGHGGFYSATSPEAFTSGLRDALKRATARVGTGASLAANSTQLQTGTVAYQANYYTAKWKGDLKALSINSTTGAIATAPTWTAATMMPVAAKRNIYTYNPDTTTYVAFATDSSGSMPSLGSAQLKALGSDTASQVAMLNYLRGDKTNEQVNSGKFRNRDTPLGDIVNSQPVYVGAPLPNQFNRQQFTGSTEFPKFANDNGNRTGLIYVAANDGMLHAFDASTGVETFAYLPGAVITNNLKNLSNPDYGSDALAHQFFNDGELAVADVYMSGAWKTVLVGTTGRGTSKTVYALDITAPANIKFLWERSAGDGLTNSNYIGQMTGKPVIAQTADNTWSVVMGNGYNSPAGAAALLQFSMADGTLNVHKTTGTTGLAAPAVWIDPAGKGVSSIAYAGDAEGHVWSFVINTGSDSTTATPASDGVLLYTATDAKGNAQPITGGMLSGRDAMSNVWLFFGTGKYLATADLGDKSTQSWYGLIVKATGTDNPAVDNTMDRTSLAQRAITSEVAGTNSTLAARSITSSSAASSMTKKSGWYIDLTSPLNGAEGERVVTPNQFQGNMLLVTTRIPKASDVCNPSGGGWIMAVNPFTGTSPSSSFFDTNGDGKIDASDNVGGQPAAGVGFGSLPNNPIFVGGSMLVSFDNGSTSSIQTSGSKGGFNRVSWREVIDL